MTNMERELLTRLDYMRSDPWIGDQAEEQYQELKRTISKNETIAIYNNIKIGDTILLAHPNYSNLLECEVLQFAEKRTAIKLLYKDDKDKDTVWLNWEIFMNLYRGTI